MKHKKLSARILSLVLTAAMVGTMLPATVFATEGDVALGTSGISKTERTITAFDELGGDYTKSVPFDGHTYALAVELDTPFEEIVLPTELGVTVERTTTTTTPPAKDEVQDDVVDSGEAPKDTAPADEPANSEPAADEPKDEVTSDEPAAQVADTDTTVSGNEPATPSDAEPAPAPEETIPVTWKGDREYTPDQNSKVIYTPVLPEGYALAHGVKLPQIYVFVGKQARTAADAVYVSATGSDTAAGTQDAPFLTIEKALTDVNTAGTVYLMSDITATTTITMPTKTVTLTSAAGEKDFTIYRGSKTGSVILLSNNNTTLTLANIILDGQSGIDGLGGSFTDSNAPNETLISVTAGTLNITDGTVIQNNNYKGISTSNNAGGGVEIKGTGVVNMNGGEISHNMGYFGGGVHCYRTAGLFNLSGGVIKQNHAVYPSGTWGGGGVYVYGGKFVMTGGLITENTTPTTTGCLGGGVYVYSGSAELKGGEIINNTAQTSAGVGYYNGTLSFSGDIKIQGNTEIESGKESNFSVYRAVA